MLQTINADIFNNIKDVFNNIKDLKDQIDKKIKTVLVLIILILNDYIEIPYILK